jgi:D-arabinose 1-dehydrogenase-like Zn-dependent alcohol dehydrogenase
LGHLALQFASKLGSKVTAVSHSTSKRQQCLEELGAHHFVNINAPDSAEFKQSQRSLDLLLVTSNYPDQPWMQYLSLLKPRGTVVLLGLPEEAALKLPAALLVTQELCLAGSLIGSRALITEMLQFAAQHQVRPWIERMPLAQVNQAVDRVHRGDVRYRMVLEV